MKIVGKRNHDSFLLENWVSPPGLRCPSPPQCQTDSSLPAWPAPKRRAISKPPRTICPKAIFPPLHNPIFAIHDIRAINIEARAVFADGVWNQLLLGVKLLRHRYTAQALYLESASIVRVETVTKSEWIDICIVKKNATHRVARITGYPNLSQRKLKELGGAGILRSEFVAKACAAHGVEATDKISTGTVSLGTPSGSGAPTRHEAQARRINSYVRQHHYSRKLGNALKSSNKWSSRRHPAEVEGVRTTAAIEALCEQSTEIFLTASDQLNSVLRSPAMNCLQLGIACIEAARILQYDTDLMSVVGNENHILVVIGPQPHEHIPPEMADWPDHWAVCDPWLNLACKKSEWKTRAILKLQDWSTPEHEKLLYFDVESDFMYSSYPPLVRQLVDTPWETALFEDLPGRPRGAIEMVKRNRIALLSGYPDQAILDHQIDEISRFSPFLTEKQWQALLETASLALACWTPSESAGRDATSADADPFIDASSAIGLEKSSQPR